MPKEPTFTKRSMQECKNCHKPVGGAPKVAPFRVDGGNSDYETFCPGCFVYLRAPKEPERFALGCYAAVHCAGCGWDTVATGRLICGNCHGGHVLVLPPPIAA
jgi:hypothetical protein